MCGGLTSDSFVLFFIYNLYALYFISFVLLQCVMNLVVDEDWYLGYHPAWTRKAKGGVRYDSAHHLEDFRGPWHAPQGIYNYIYKNICKIGN
jgi:hypothetical protein